MNGKKMGLWLSILPRAQKYRSEPQPSPPLIIQKLKALEEGAR